MDYVKLPKFSGERRDFDVRKKRFRAFGLMQRWAPALLENDAATVQQHLDLYSIFIVALPEDGLSIIENVHEVDKNCGLKAWTAWVDHYEDGGISRLAELLHDMEKALADDKTCLRYLNRLVRLQRQLTPVGKDVHDRRVIMYLVKGLRPEHNSITDTWNVHGLIMDAVKRDVRQKGMGIDNRGRTPTEVPPLAAFLAFPGDTCAESLKR
jgi:hypothetical protein